ncbi:putative necrosis-inducing factor-domain-containing protein [Triangularia verruculosa]|uniref:Necrosis-inducing factor-domain-containing protein n=1 Tax=Triangularia verruculosa TaxID=2587418 RepID=A0AAN6X8U2_9PEZI|nr:putative necrosis-inducing factor-domain-containing protein [Triangularia verruculosa]
MQFKAIFTTLLAAATAAECAPQVAPAVYSREVTLNPTYPENTGLAINKRSDRCGHSTFENRGSAGSPWVTDCERMANNLSGSGTWTYSSFDRHKTIASHGTCAFGIEAAQLFQGVTHVGTQDVKDIVRDSIIKFRRSDGKVGARGEMQCGPAGSPSDIRIAWGLF